MARKALSKKIRFEVFKRDSFRCQYCGRSAPDVILHVDHIKPVKEGGTNDLTNLITSCFDCNMGKKDRLLDDRSILEKQKQQLEELNERRLQLEMMMEWREGLVNLEEQKVEFVNEHWSKRTNGHYSLNENGLKTVRTMLKKFDMNIILDSMDAASNQYVKYDKDDKPTQETVEKAFKMVPRICTNKARDQEKPYLRDLYYIRGILKNRLSYLDEAKTIRYLESAYLKGVSIETLKDHAKQVRNWTEFRYDMDELLEGEGDLDG